jgi:broad specificity phosphatase PhoE
LWKEVTTQDTKSALWFVRHGESTWNAAGLVQGQAHGPVLTDKGRSEAARLVEHLVDINVTSIYTSDLERALQTATIVSQELGVALQIDPALRERNLGVAQGRPLRELDSAHSGVEGECVVDAAARPAGGESLREMYDRVSAFVDELKMAAPDGDALVVTHGGVIRVAQAYCAGIGAEAMAWGPVPNASVWRLGRSHPSVAVVQ